MKKELLEKVLFRYTSMASVLLGTQAVQGQVVWTDIADTTLTQNDQYFDLDIDGNNEVDFRITQFVDSLNGLDLLTGVMVETFGTAGNQVMGINYQAYNYPFRLNVADTISSEKLFKGLGASSTPNRDIGYMGLGVNGATYPNSQFVDSVNGITNGFLGLKFRSDVNDTIRTFYGWVRLDVAADLRSVTIKDFAYQSTYDSLITAGQGSPIGIEELEVPTPELVQHGLYLDVNLPEGNRPKAEISFYSLNGNLIKQAKIKETNSTFPLADLPKGMLVAVIRHKGMDTSKKVIVY